MRREPESATQRLAAARFRLAIEMVAEGGSLYPDGAAFVAADLENLGEIVAEYAKEPRPVVLVYADGEERVLLAHAASQNA